MIVRKKIRQSQFLQNVYYALKIDNVFLWMNIWGGRNAIASVCSEFLPKETPEMELRKIKKDIRRCYYKYKISPSEYFLFDFVHKKDDYVRGDFLPDKWIYIIMAQIVGRKIHDVELEDKYRFYQLTKSYFKREVMTVKGERDRQAFVKFSIQQKKVIIKPNSSACGCGIYVATISNELEAKHEFDRMCQHGGKWIIEELITQSSIMASWNSSSVNTVRVSSFLKNGKFHVLCPFIRVGRQGCVVDNGGQGGLYAAIDASTGRIMTDGKDEKNKVHQAHPDSGVHFIGWQVPDWQELMALTEEVHRRMPNHRYIGWDFAHTDSGWVLIEGNWGEFIAQQSTTGVGMKKQFFEYVGYAE